MKQCKLKISREHFDVVMRHLYPGDLDEHGLVILAGLQRQEGQITLLTREVHLAREGVDYVPSRIGHRALTPQFIHRMITRARDKGLVYLAVHNHLSDRTVDFSDVDLRSHERGYPALLQISEGMPVGALVFGRRSIQADLWLSRQERLQLSQAIVVGPTVQRFYPAPLATSQSSDISYERQIRMFGAAGQGILAQTTVAIVGLGGIGSIAAELVARLGVGKICLIDDDRIEPSNFSRIINATRLDLIFKRYKVYIARRAIRRANPKAKIEVTVGDVSSLKGAKMLTASDYIILAADSMRARLLTNAVTHQYLIPGVQLGAKIRAKDDGSLLAVMAVNRPIRPGIGCLWCNGLIDPAQLAIEAKSDDERKAQAYGVVEPNPSVITLNAVAASHGVNDLLLSLLGLRSSESELFFDHFDFLHPEKSPKVRPRRDDGCTECAETGKRYAMGDGLDLPY